MKLTKTSQQIQNWINEQLSEQGYSSCQAGGLYHLDELDENGCNWASQVFSGENEIHHVYSKVVELAKVKFNLAE